MIVSVRMTDNDHQIMICQSHSKIKKSFDDQELPNIGDQFKSLKNVMIIAE